MSQGQGQSSLAGGLQWREVGRVVSQGQGQSSPAGGLQWREVGKAVSQGQGQSSLAGGLQWREVGRAVSQGQGQSSPAGGLQRREVRKKLESRGIHVAGDCIQVETEDAVGIQGLIDQLRAAGVVIRGIKEMRSSLEEVFLQAVETNREAVA